MIAPLFVPASRSDRFAKAAASGADAVILDLEDAVAAADKDTARAALTADLGLPVVLRINGAGTPWHQADLAAAARLSLAAVMLPKAEDAATVAAVAASTGHKVIALIETARGLANARSIAVAARQLAFGSVDFCADLRCAHESALLLPVRSELVLASRLAGVAPPLDGVTLRIDGPEAGTDAAHARALGMAGKLCIHPRQVAAAQAAFAPSPAEIDWASRVLASGDGAVAVDGEMVDEPVRARARAILNRAAP